MTEEVIREIMEWNVRAYFARKRRRLFDEKKARAVRYDHQGKPIDERVMPEPRQGRWNTQRTDYQHRRPRKVSTP